MKKNHTITLSAVRELLRRSDLGTIVDRSGWGVYQHATGEQLYIFDDSAQPVAYAKLNGLGQKKRSSSAFLAIPNDFV